MTPTETFTSRERILTCARDLILSRGFAAMTLDAVCASAQVTKGAFFHHFSSKEVLGATVLDQFWQNVQVRQNAASYQKSKNDIEYVIGYLDHAIEAYQDPNLRKGCMLAIFTMELSDSYPALYKQSANYFNSWKVEMQGLLDKLAKGLHINDFDTQAWTEMYISTLEGSLLLAKASDDPDVIVRALQLYKGQLIQRLNINK